MTGVQQLAIAAQDDGVRFDRWVRKQFPKLPHSRLQKLLRTGQFRVDGARAKSNTRLKHGQTVRIPPMPDQASAPPQSKKPLADAERRFIQDLVIFKDDRIIALNKPAGLAVQGGSKTTRHIDGMLDALAASGERPRLVHRLDRDTSGLLILARTSQAARELSFAFQQHRIKKLYWAIVRNKPARPEGVIDLALAKQGGSGKERMQAVDLEYDRDGKFARTAYQILASAGKSASLLALLPLTGRTHQLRAHCAAINTPILGDGKYGGKAALETNAPKGLMLHARELSLDLHDLPKFSFPKFSLKADPPDHFIQALGWMGVEHTRFRYAALEDWRDELTKFT